MQSSLRHCEIIKFSRKHTTSETLCVREFHYKMENFLTHRSCEFVSKILYANMCIHRATSLSLYLFQENSKICKLYDWKLFLRWIFISIFIIFIAVLLIIWSTSKKITKIYIYKVTKKRPLYNIYILLLSTVLTTH
jgi:hypothetical protein